jgi:hypothetical protein
MHDKHEADCCLCEKFVLPFDEDSPLADWGYCEEEGQKDEVTQEKLEEIEEQVKKGDYCFLTKKKIPLYQAVGEGCEKFIVKVHH